MSYQPPRGDQIHGTFTAGDYTPPDPLAIHGTFGAAQQVERRLLVASLDSTWIAAAAAGAETTSNISAAGTTDHVYQSASPPSVAVDFSIGALWSASQTLDARDLLSAWLLYSGCPKLVVAGLWLSSRSADVDQATGWGVYDDAPTVAIAAPWVSAIPVDSARAPRWIGNLTPMWREIPHVLPDISMVDIQVVGGGLRGRFPADNYSVSAGDQIHGTFAAGEYIAPAPIFPGTIDHRVPFRSFSVTVGAPRKPVLDDQGEPVLVSAIVDTHWQAPWEMAVVRDREFVIRWDRYARRLNPGWGIVVPGDPSGPTPGQQIVIPIRRAYIVRNEVLMARADDLSVIHARDLSINIEADSLATFSAKISRMQLDAVMPSPALVEVLMWINGTEFRFLIDPPGVSRQFGQHDISISGKALAAELGGDIADSRQHGNTVPMTAQQLVAAALEFTGYDIEWAIDDWLVPAGALSLHGTPMDVAAYVADSVGAVLQCAWADRALRFMPRYPVKPWDYAAASPDIIIPSAACQVIGIDPVTGPAYNRVIVSGTVDGSVTGNVKIAGTAGDRPAAMVAHPLITHVTAATQRGLAILCGAGNKTEVGLQMQIPPGVGVIDVGRFVQFNDGATTRRGITRGNRITTGDRVRQTVTVEAA